MNEKSVMSQKLFKISLGFLLINFFGSFIFTDTVACYVKNND